ncbi:MULTISPECIES: hypothetical protein [unclassified Nocardia]
MLRATIPLSRVSGIRVGAHWSTVVLRPDFDVITAIDPHGRLIGVVTATDLSLAVQRSALGLPARRPE